MKLWAITTSTFAPFDPFAGMQWQEIEIFSLKISEILNSVTEIEITRLRSGWQILQGLASLDPNSHRALSILFSATGSVADREVIAVGRLAEVPGDLLSPLQTFRYLCASEDVDAQKLAYVQEFLDGAPFTDFIFDDVDPGHPESYLVARSEVFAVDPVTHAVSTIDESTGNRLVDMTGVSLADKKRMSDKPGLYPPPASTLRIRAYAEWTQAASGELNIGYRLPMIYSLDPGISASPESYVRFIDGDGWSPIGGASGTRERDGGEALDPLFSVRHPPIGFGAIYSGRRSVRSNHWVTAWSGPSQSPGTNSMIPTTVSSFRDLDGNGIPPIDYNVRPGFRDFRHKIEDFWLAYDYSQARAETLYVALDCPLPTALMISSSEEITDVGVKSVFEDPTIPLYENLREYGVDDLVRHGDRYYRCVEDHYSDFFEQPRPSYVYDLQDPTQPKTYWLRIYPEGLNNPATLTAFWDSDRGRQACEHLVLRLRKQALRRLQFRHVILTYRWQDAAYIRLSDSIRFLIPWAGDTLRPVIGKVFSIERTWDGKSQPLITVEVAVSFGTGPYLLAGGPYFEDGLVEGGYVQTEIAPSEIEWRMEQLTAPIVPVPTNLLGNASFMVISTEVENSSSEQVDKVGEVAESGKPLEDVSIVYPTTIRVRMRPLQSRELLHREIDVVGQLLTTPAGVEL